MAVECTMCTMKYEKNLKLRFIIFVSTGDNRNDELNSTINLFLARTSHWPSDTSPIIFNQDRRNVSLQDRFFFLQSRTIKTTSGKKGIFGNDGKTFANSWPAKGWTEEFDKFHACDKNLPAGVRYCNPGVVANEAFFKFIFSLESSHITTMYQIYDQC